jgi:hypothetical protein
MSCSLLSGNEISDKGVQHVAEALRTNQCLTSIDLSGE